MAIWGEAVSNKALLKNKVEIASHPSDARNDSLLTVIARSDSDEAISPSYCQRATMLQSDRTYFKKRLLRHLDGCLAMTEKMLNFQVFIAII
ncbi:hypothetical protein [Thermodesulfovibrio hydrogeniphilus]